jgi:Ca2+-transporting ATPase
MEEKGVAMENWYQQDVDEVVDYLKSDRAQGLSDAEAAERLQIHGPNELIEKDVKSPWKILLEQLSEIMVVILIISAIISAILGEATDAIVILIIVALNSILGFTQEYRAEKAMAALKKMAVPQVRVMRGGHVRTLPAQQLVPGDLILIEAGNSIPADARLIESINLRVQEAVLTGESEPVEKHTDSIQKESLPIGDRKNQVFMGTIATYGRGSALVVQTGMNTELGHIAEMLQTVGQEQTPLQRRLVQLGKGLAIASLGIVAVVFVFGLLRGEELKLMFQTAISMAVAAVPEGLPAVVTIALALGAQRMLRRESLIRKLPAVETLGSVTVICSDKTGTLTQNQMTVTVLDVAGNTLNFKERANEFRPSNQPNPEAEELFRQESAVGLLLAGGALCNDALLEPKPEDPGSFSAVGDPTEGALVIAAAQSGLWKEELEEELPRVSELPFDSDRKRMTTVHRYHSERLRARLACVNCVHLPETGAPFIAFTKGAVDSLLDVSNHVLTQDQVHPLTAEWRQRIMEANNRMAQDGMRVLGLAYRFLDQSATNLPEQPVESDLVFIGMIGMIDPARPEVKDAVRTAKSAGIRPIMITGDHPLTALYIARELGIDNNGRVVTGQELAHMTVEQLEAQVYETSVYARVSPEHKLKIVQALQDKGEVVAMTGDGVNDAPALKRADIGVAMGITGTDVSKEASDMVLLDDNFATIVAAVEEGRRIYDNIRKFIRYTLTSNAGEIWVMLLAPFVGLPMPLTPIQILWVNLVTDGVPGLALTVEPTEPNTMRRKPYPINENFFGRGMGRDVLWIGLLMGLVSLVVGLISYSANDPAWQTMVFTTLTLSQMGNALAIRSNKYSLFQIGLFSNKLMLLAVVATFLLQMAVVYVPFLQGVFRTTALTLPQLAISIAFSVIVFIAIEIFKWFLRRREN